MNKDSNMNASEALNERSLPNFEIGNLDLVILRYMTQRIYVTLYLLDEPVDSAQPLLYYTEEGRKHTHRIAIYRPEELMRNSSLDLVGFISAKSGILRHTHMLPTSYLRVTTSGYAYTMASCLVDWLATRSYC